MAQPSLFPNQQYLLGIRRSSEERAAFMLIPKITALRDRDHSQEP
jgi:hypothetical protein